MSLPASVHHTHLSYTAVYWLIHNKDMSKDAQET